MTDYTELALSAYRYDRLRRVTLCSAWPRQGTAVCEERGLQLVRLLSSTNTIGGVTLPAHAGSTNIPGEGTGIKQFVQSGWSVHGSDKGPAGLWD